jgi:MFS family permease
MMRRARRWLTIEGNPAFTWLWWSQTVSIFGNQVTLVAIPLLAALSLKATPLEMGMLVAVETVPYLAFSLPAGVLADRADRRRLMIVSNLARAGLLLLIPASAILGFLGMPWLYLIAFGVGTFSVIFDVAYQSYVPDLLAPGELLTGNQRIELSESAARTIGPGFGGAIVAVAGGAMAIIVDAVGYLLATVALLRARRPAVPEPPAPEVPAAIIPDLGTSREPDKQIGLILDIWDYVAALEARLAVVEAKLAEQKARALGATSAFAGISIVLKDRVLRDMAASTATFNLASSAIIAVFVLYAATEAAMDPTSIGVLIAVGNVGFVLGALAVGSVTARFGVGPVLVASGLLGAVATMILPFAVGATAAGFLLAGRFVGAFAIPFYNVNARALRQTRAPREALGRVNAVFRLIDWGALPIGALLGGLVGNVFGLRATLVMGGVLGVLSAAWLVWSPLRQVRRLGGADEVAASADEQHRARWSLPSLVGAAGAIGWSLSYVGRLPTIRWAGLAIGGALLQFALFLPEVNSRLGSLPPILYVVSSLAVLACLVRNARIPGLAIAAVGGIANLVAIIANGGRMPVDPAAARIVGHVPPTGYTNTVEQLTANLKPLTDIIAVPPPLPFANVYSLGDVLLVVGIAVTVSWALFVRRPGPPDDRGASPQQPSEATRLAGTGFP